MLQVTPKRLLMTTDAVGGVWRYSLDLARGLRSLGVETVLAGLGPAPDAAQRAEAAKVATLHWIRQPLDWTVDSADALADVPQAIADLAESVGADTIQCNQPSQAAGMQTRARVIAVSHSCVVSWFRAVRGTDVPDGWHWQRALNADGLARADRVVAPSRAHADLMKECYDSLGTVAVVPNAALPPVRSDAKQPFAFAAARWWDEGKDAATLDAAAALADWPVLAFGPCARDGVPAVRFAHARARGARPHSEVTAAAGSAGIFVSPSIYEPFGLAALEAAAGGAALVLADIPTYRENWEGAALFAPPRDANAFAARINQLSRDPRLRARMAAAARTRAATFTPDRQSAAMHDLLDGLSQPQKEAL